MPKYTFKCSKCDKDIKRYVSASVLTIACPDCGSSTDRLLPSSNSPTDVNEVVDKYFGINHKKDHQQLLKARKDEFYWSIEVPRMVNSGTYSVETMLENGWIYFDDKKQMHIHTKPPSAR